jgi:hypothetical protein
MRLQFQWFNVAAIDRIEIRQRICDRRDPPPVRKRGMTARFLMVPLLPERGP